jgi:hypothetical protein
VSAAPRHGCLDTPPAPSYIAPVSPVPELPGFRPYDKAYESALDQTAELLRAADLDGACARTGARREGNALVVDYFGAPVGITLPDVAFSPEDMRIQDKILVLRYLTSEEGRPESTGYAAFQNLPNGMFYQVPFRKRSVDRLLGTFGGNPHGLIEAGAAVGGEPWDLGDAAVRLRVFPYVDAVVVIYEGDDEFPVDGNVLFGDNVATYLTLEDVAVLGGKIAGMLCKAASR